jgi:hypothetical protein
MQQQSGNPRDPHRVSRGMTQDPRMVVTTGAPDARFIHPWAFS